PEPRRGAGAAEAAERADDADRAVAEEAPDRAEDAEAPDRREAEAAEDTDGGAGVDRVVGAVPRGAAARGAVSRGAGSRGAAVRRLRPFAVLGVFASRVVFELFCAVEPPWAFWVLGRDVPGRGRGAVGRRAISRRPPRPRARP